MSDPLVPDQTLEKERQEQDSRIQRQVAFAAGIFQADITVHTLLESIPDGFVAIDKFGIILFVNARAEQMFGYPKQELCGKHHSVLIPERFRKAHQEHEAHFFEAPRIRPMGQLLELAGFRRDGSEFPMELSLGFIETIKGILVLALVSDITLPKQVEKALRESEELFRNQVECAKEYAIYTLDARGNVFNWNLGAERLFGYRAEEITGKHFSCFYTKQERNADLLADRLNRAAAEGQVADEGWRIRKDGSRFWADAAITALREADGNLRGFSNVTHDITVRKRAEDALRFSEARYRALYHDNPAMIVTVDAEWQILSANPSFNRQLGYSTGELEGRSVLKIFHEDDRPAVVEQLRRCLQNPDQVHSWQFRKVCKDGGLVWVEERAQAVYDLHGNLNLLIVCQDITQRKRAEEEREQLLGQLHAVLDSINEGVIITDLEGNVLTMNQSALALHEYENVEQIRLQVQQFQESFELSNLDGDLIPFEKCPLARALQGEHFIDYEIRVRRKDSDKSWIGSYSGTPVQGKSGDTILSVVTLRDITERKKAEVALRKSELKLSRIFHAVPALIGITTIAEGRCIDVNETGLATLGYRREEMIGRTMQELGVWESESARERMIRALQENGLVRDLEITFKGKNGKKFTGLISAEPIALNGEQYLLSIVNDITDRKRMEEEIERLNTDLAVRAAELESANRELEAFNYTVAHDLRQPLNIISSYCQAIEALCADKLGNQCLDYLRETYTGTLRMNRLIEDLLNFSRLARAELHREKVDICAIAKGVAEELKLAEPKRQVMFQIAEGLAAEGDESLLRVVLHNLLGNAWKYTGTREAAVIEFGAMEIEGEHVFFIRDNGTGFDMTDASKLFTPFKRLRGSEDFRGFGVGLDTVERVIRRHGGRIWAEGEPGKGATFFFTLPADGN